MRLATVRYYFDADILGLGKLVARLRSDATFPGDPGYVIHKCQRPPCVVTKPETADIEWIPIVASDGMVIITRDAAIQHSRSEIEIVVKYKAKMLTLSGKDAKTVWSQLEVVMCQWRWIERVRDQPGPFIYRVTRTGHTNVL